VHELQSAVCDVCAVCERAWQAAAIADGRVRVRDKVVPLDHILRDGDWVTHTSHRHEPPVSAEAVEVVHECEDFVRAARACVHPLLSAHSVPPPPSHTHAVTHRHTQSHTQSHAHTQSHTHTVTHTYIHIHTHTCTHLNTHSHTRTRAPSPPHRQHHLPSHPAPRLCFTACFHARLWRPDLPPIMTLCVCIPSTPPCAACKGGRLQARIHPGAPLGGVQNEYTGTACAERCRCAGSRSLRRETAKSERPSSAWGSPLAWAGVFAESGAAWDGRLAAGPSP
jgi:hypothetical protein